MMKNKMPTGAATPMGEVGRQKKRRKLSVKRIIALIFWIVILALVIVAEWPKDTVWIQEAHTVRTGETLWSIATDLQEDGDVREDVREIIWCIEKINKLNPKKFIQPGDELVIWKKVLRQYGDKDLP